MRTSRSLHARFRTVVLVVAAAMSIVVAAIVYLSARTHYLSTGEASARAMVSAVEPTVAIGAYARDAVLLKELVDGLSRHPSVARVEVLDAVGATLAANALRASDGMVGSATFETALMSPFDAQETSGRMRVWLDAAALSAGAARQAAAVAGALIVLLASMLAVFNGLASRLLSRPMHRLAEALSRIEPGSGDRVPLRDQHAHDEVGVVTRAANRLLDLQQEALQRERAMRDEIAAMEARYRGIFDSTSAGIFIMTRDGSLLQANPALGRLLGVDNAADADASGSAFAHDAFVDASALFALVEIARSSAQPEATDLALRRIDGSEIWVHCMVTVIEAPDGQTRVEGVLYDITQRRSKEQSAQHRAEHDALTGLKSRAFIEASLDQQVSRAQRDARTVTLMFIDLDGFKGVNDRWGHAAGDAVLVESARRLRTLFKRSCDLVGRLGGDELVVLIEGTDARDPMVSEMARQLIHSFATPFQLPSGEEARIGASVGVASYPMHATNAQTLIHAADAAMYAVKQSGKGGFVVAVEGGGMPTLAPASSAKRGVPAQHDPLTGLPDRRQLDQRLSFAHARVVSGQGSAAVICVDIAQFRSINLAHGTHAGDELLCEVARRLSGALRREDSLARTGSDEFVAVVMVDETDRDKAAHTATEVAHKLLRVMDAPFQLAERSVSIQARAGVSLVDPQAPHAADALREAQLALRRSKTSARAGVVFFEPDMLAGFHERLSLEADLRAAIGTEQFRLHVQPQVDAAGDVCAGEALLRWNHPTRGAVAPGDFIALAESCGAIVELGRWVLREGCDVLARMQRAGGTQTLSVNISPVQFSHPEFVRDVRAALEDSGACAHGLVLEITEGLLISDIAQASARLNELVRIGVRFSIDDFGTGFSSLAYLRQLPLHEIKIDRSFINNLPGESACAGIVRAILSMGQHLGLQVVAEGVETAGQSEFLARHGCTRQQGWLHGRPQPVDDFLLRLNATNQNALLTTPPSTRSAAPVVADASGLAM